MKPPADRVGPDLDALARLLQHPFRRREDEARLLADPIARRWLGGGEAATNALLAFLRTRPPPPLAGVAVLLLAQSASDAVYQELLQILGTADAALAGAFEPGLWRVPKAEEGVVRDIVHLAAATGNPAPLLLLQRPSAAAAKPELEALVRSRAMPGAEYAMTALAYASGPADIPFLEQVAQWLDQPPLSAAAGVALLRLGSSAGWPGIEAGLTAAYTDQRVATLLALRPLLPEPLRRSPGFDPYLPPDRQAEALAKLRDACLQ